MEIGLRYVRGHLPLHSMCAPIYPEPGICSDPSSLTCPMPPRASLHLTHPSHEIPLVCGTPSFSLWGSCLVRWPEKPRRSRHPKSLSTYPARHTRMFLRPGDFEFSISIGENEINPARRSAQTRQQMVSFLGEQSLWLWLGEAAVLCVDSRWHFGETVTHRRRQEPMYGPNGTSVWSPAPNLSGSAYQHCCWHVIML